MKMLLLFTILFPILMGACLPLRKFENGKDKRRNIYVIFSIFMTSIFVLLNIMMNQNTSVQVIELLENMTISFKIDQLSILFLIIIAFLWPLTTFYAFEYMEHEGNENKFFTFFTMTYGVVIGLACSANLITFYFMYECLTFATLPLVTHAMDKRAMKAGKKYFIYSIFGASLAFVGIMILSQFSTSLEFVYGGILDESKIGNNQLLIQIGYLFTFFGFGVKAAIFPFHGWLPAAGVAPTPVTALLHAVAVVKAGVFAIMRVTFYSFGTTLLVNTFVQDIVLGFACFTIVFGSCMAWKEQHLKRRFAYSTISNLSYILVGIGLMTPEGFVGAMSHMFMHAIMKICLFFCVGVIMAKTHKEFVYQIEGYGTKMPVTFASFIIGACSLSGIPLFAGFISKSALATAAVLNSSVWSLVIVVCLLISAILTAAYTFEICIKGFVISKGFNMSRLEGKSDPSWFMKAPLVILCACMILCGLFATDIMNFISMIAFK